MKNLFLYYLAIGIPLVGIIYLYKYPGGFNSGLFVGLFAFYLFIYRTYTDGLRLAEKNLIPRKDIWKLIIPGKRLEYFKELYLQV